MKLRYYYILLFLITILPRFVVFFSHGPGLSKDSLEYLSLAKNIQERGQFAISIELHDSMAVNKNLMTETIADKQFPERFTQANPPRLTMFRTPGYPLFVALIMFLSGNNLYIISIVQILMAGLSALLLFSILLALSRQIGLIKYENLITFLIVVVIFSLQPGLIVHSRNILRETLEIFLVILSIYLWQRSGKLSNAILLGIVLGFLFLSFQAFSYTIYAFVLWIIIGAVMKLIRREEVTTFIRQTFTKNLVIAFVLSLVILNAWSFRNYVRFGEWTGSSFKTGALLLFQTFYLDDKRDDSIDDPDIASYRVKYPSRNETVNHFLDEAYARTDELDILKIKRNVYMSDDRRLVEIDPALREYAMDILLKHYKKSFLSEVLASTYNLFRADYFARLDGKNATGEVRSPSVVKKLKSMDISFVDVLWLGQWLFFLLVIFSFFLMNVPAFIKAMFTAYMLPYAVFPVLETRTTIFYWIFIAIALMYLIHIIFNTPHSRDFLKFRKKPVIEN